MHLNKYDFFDESTLILQLKKGNEDAYPPFFYILK